MPWTIEERILLDDTGGFKQGNLSDSDIDKLEPSQYLTTRGTLLAYSPTRYELENSLNLNIGAPRKQSGLKQSISRPKYLNFAVLKRPWIIDKD